MISHSEIMHQPIETVWEHFIYKIEHPEHFVPGVSHVVIRERHGDHVVRAMDIALPGGSAATVVEKITHAPYWVRFEIIDHPVYSGHVDNLAEKLSDTETRITYTLHWVNKATGEPFSNQDVARNAVLKTVEFISKAH
jgi:hypothetical protein